VPILSLRAVLRNNSVPVPARKLRYLPQADFIHVTQPQRILVVLKSARLLASDSGQRLDEGKFGVDLQLDVRVEKWQRQKPPKL
jgi:hypothetical protein